MMTSRITSRIGSVAMFVFILVCVSMFVFSTPVAAEDSFKADRTDVDTVTVTFDVDRQVNLSISDPEGVAWSATWDTEDAKEIDITEIHDGIDMHADLTDATIRAESDSGSVNDTVPLQKIERDGTHTSWIADGDLHVPLDAEATAGTDSSVSLSIDENTTISGEIHDTQSRLEVSHDDLVSETSVQNELSFTPVTDDGVDIGEEISLEPDLRTVDQTQHLYHPAFDGDTSYNLTGFDIDTEPSDGLIDVSSIALDDNSIAFEDENISDIDVDSREVPELDGSGTVGDSTLDVDGLPSGISSATVLVVDEDGILTEFADAEISSVELEDESFDDPDRIVLQTTAGLFEVTDIDWSDPENEDEDSGGLLGIFSLSFGFYHGAFLGVFAAGLLAGLGSYALFGRQKGHSFEPILAVVIWTILTGVFIIILALVVEVDLLIDGPDASTVSDIALLVGIALAGGLAGTLSYTVPTFVWTGSTSTVQKRPVEFNITKDSQPVTRNVAVEAKPVGGNSSARTQTFNLSQSKPVKLEPGMWEFTVLYGSNQFPAATTKQRIPSDGRSPHSVSIEFEAAQVQVGIADERTEELLHHGTVQFKAAGQSKKHRLDDGVATYDPPKQASVVKIHISCDKYESKTIERDIAQTDWPVVETVRPKIGSLDITSTVDTEPVGNMTIELTPNETVVQTLWKRADSTDANGTFTATTDTNGSYSIGRRDETTPPLFAGSYTVRARPPETNSQYFRADEQTVNINNREKSRVNLSVPFTWSIDQHQHRIDKLRSDVQDLSAQSHRDAVIPQYFGTVMMSTLDAVEQIPDQGHLFSKHDIAPGDLTETILTATDEMTHVIDTAMSTKRNVDLFSACSNLPDTDVQWEGSFSLSDLLECSDQSLATSRRSFAEELEATSELIQSERQELTELSPVKELHSRVSDNAPSSQGDNDLEAITTLYLSELLLDAIKQAFDEPDIRKRLDQTVF